MELKLFTINNKDGEPIRYFWQEKERDFWYDVLSDETKKTCSKGEVEYFVEDLKEMQIIAKS